ncbi:cell wall hydrolase [Clostridium frigoris]|uniref:Cell wall hydrolase n=1 Tax=Clostridium frigoris TaxID=205327 RepID=A0ABS6BUV6_9CLOT|nr:cell wall hydrolase [Clostridium frigoris]MBU3160700.1 cell wall hydrolase [Clostridium frigoris]
MINFKSFKSVFLTSALTIGISVITSQNIFAATLTTYTVKSGDCLSVIAKTHGESLTNLMKANSNCDGFIFPGQVLKIPVTTNSTKVLAKPIASKSAAIKYTSSDFSLLARLITAEAQGESYKAQVAVGSVVVNRVKSSSFPNSLSSVINQKYNGSYQFTPIQNGNINTSADATAVKAAKAALSGTDSTNNALFFYSGNAPKTLTLKQPGSIKIDNLTFVGIIKN